MFKLACLSVLLALVVFEADACPGLFGGGGCGCMPPPPPCGCGRKKREVLTPQVKTKESDPCPQKEWKNIMSQAISDDEISSVYAIQGALYKQYEAKFFVTCSRKSETNPNVFVANGDGYCSFGTDKVWCEALALFG